MKIARVTAHALNPPVPIKASGIDRTVNRPIVFVEIETDTGLVGLGELGGGGESAEAAVRAMRDYLVGHDVFQTEALRFNPWTTGPGIHPSGWLNLLRDAAYRASQRGRRG